MTRTFDPVAVLEEMRPTGPADTEALARVRERVIPGAASSPRKPKPSRPRKTFAVAAGLAALAVGGVALTQVLSAPPAAATPPMLTYETDVAAVVNGTAPDGTAVTDSLAAAAGEQHTEATTNVSLVQSSSWSIEVVHPSEQPEDYRLVVVPVQRSVWSSAVDGAMRFLEVMGTPLDPDGEVELPEVTPTGPPVLDYRLPADHDRGAISTKKLPTDPERLVETVVSGTRPPHGCAAGTELDCLVDAFTSLTGSVPVPADLKAAFWTAIGDQGGVYTLGATSDRLDRTGVTIAYAVPEGGVQVLIADPDTGALLGTESIDTTGTITESEPPAVWRMEVFRQPRWVDGFESS